jgi:hypothetical protein
VLIPNNEVDQLLSRINSTLNTLSGTQAPIQSPNVSIPQAPIIETPKAPQEIPISGILLARIMPEIYPKKIENS